MYKWQHRPALQDTTTVLRWGVRLVARGISAPAAQSARSCRLHPPAPRAGTTRCPPRPPLPPALSAAPDPTARWRLRPIRSTAPRARRAAITAQFHRAPPRALRVLRAGMQLWLQPPPAPCAPQALTTRSMRLLAAQRARRAATPLFPPAPPAVPRVLRARTRLPAAPRAALRAAATRAPTRAWAAPRSVPVLRALPGSTASAVPPSPPHARAALAHTRPQSAPWRLPTVCLHCLVWRVTTAWAAPRSRPLVGAQWAPTRRPLVLLLRRAVPRAPLAPRATAAQAAQRRLSCAQRGHTSRAPTACRAPARRGTRPTRRRRFLAPGLRRRATPAAAAWCALVAARWQPCVRRATTARRPQPLQHPAPARQGLPRH